MYALAVTSTTRSHDIFCSAMGGGNFGGDPIAEPELLAKKAEGAPLVQMLTTPLMHGNGQWVTWITLFSAGTAVMWTGHRYDPAEILRTIEREGCVTMMLVGDAMARPIADELENGGYDVSTLKVIGSGGALLSPSVKAQLTRLVPGLYISDSFGASEFGAGSSQTPGGRFPLKPQTAVLGEDLRPVGAGESGRLARTGYIPIGYYKDPVKTADTFHVDPDGVRWVIPGDFARVEDDGDVTLLGPRLGVHQHRRREGVPRRGRGRPQGARGRLRRGRGGRAGPALRRTRRRGRVVARGPHADLGRPGRARARSHRGLQGPARVGRGRRGAADTGGQARLPVGQDDGGSRRSPCERTRSVRFSRTDRGRVTPVDYRAGMTAVPPPDGLLATGIRWQDGRPALVLVDSADVVTTRPIGPGTVAGWRFAGPRTCVGIRRRGGGRRVACRNPLPEGAPRAQCETCAAIDPGRALARDQAMDDPRPFSLYLAWFGPGLVKVGLTATERRAARLADQGAPFFTWLAHGPLIAVRGTERVCSATGTVRERIPHKAKVTAWWRPREAGLPAELAAAHARLTPLLPDSLTPAPCLIQDLTRFYGLAEPPPATTTQAAGMREGARLHGEFHCRGRPRRVAVDRHRAGVRGSAAAHGLVADPGRRADRDVPFKPLDNGLAPDGSVQEGLF